MSPHVPASLCVASLAGLLTAAVAGLAAEAALEGTVRLEHRGREAPARVADPRQAVVYFEPDGWRGGPSSDGVAVVNTRDKEFLPRVTTVAPGTEIRFPNEDPILHNVFSVSADNSFDVGLYGQGPGRSWVAEHPGVVRVYCNVHHDMVAYILVLDTPFVTRPDRDGRFRLEGLPAGGGTLHVWHDRAERWEERISAPAAERLEAILEITRPRVPPHLNKLGQPYRRDGRGRRYP